MPTSPLASLFGGHSPFRGLQLHMRTVKACSDQVVPLVEALIAADLEGQKVISAKIFALENDADKAKNSLREHLPRSLFMPVNRRDFLEVLDLQDSIADTAQDIAGLLLEREMTVPEPMKEGLLALTRECVGVVDKCAEIIELFDELVEVGFGGRVAAKVHALATGVNEAEHTTDELGSALSRTLFSLEDAMKPVSVVMWHQQIERIGDLADFAEKVSNRVRLLIAH